LGNFDLQFWTNGAARATLDTSGNLSVSANISGYNLSGTNTGDQTNISGRSNTVLQYPNCTDATFYQAVWSNAAAGDYKIYSTANVSIQSSGYGAIGFYNNWTIGGSNVYGLITNTGLHVGGNIWTTGIVSSGSISSTGDIIAY
jgi:hypothetical protein